jgi:hypothetical protein
MLPDDWNAKEGDTDTQQVREVTQLDVFESLEPQADGRPRAKMTIIKAGMSANRRNYRPGALEAAANAGRYNGIRMFVDHSDKPPLKRSFNEMVSAVESAEWNPTTSSVEGTVVFFDPAFAEKVKHARGYMGASVNNLIRATKIPQPDGTVMEDVQSIERVHSLDWVVYPAAGGELQHFLEAEGDAVDWSKVTIEDLKANAPGLVAILTKEAEKEPDPPDDPDDDGDGKLTKEAVATMLAEALRSHDAERDRAAAQQRAASAMLTEHLTKSGLPQVVRARMQKNFMTMDPAIVTEALVTESINEAKEELKELKVGPQIVGMGPTAGSNGRTQPGTQRMSVRESVEGFFAPSKKAATEGASGGAK